MQEQMYFPEGGVGSFLTSNMDEMPDNVLDVWSASRALTLWAT